MNVKAIFAVLLIFGSLPFAAASNQVQSEGGDIEGRAILFDLTRFDPDLAAVAGHAKSKVSWFNGAITFDKEDQGFVYATPAGTGSPIGERLIPTGTWYNFTDDNGATWNVQEWYYLKVHTSQYKLGGQTATERMAFRVHVWTVESSTAPIEDQLMGLTYNFVVVVDVSKLGLVPFDEDQKPAGWVLNPEGDGTGNIDLHFTKRDPRSQCLGCS